jgi:outer membrane receptor protein involved in Fe transport
MITTARLSGLLLATTALAGVPVLAQTPPAEEPPAERSGPVVFDDEIVEEEVEVSAPGAGGLDAGEIVVVGRRIPNIVRTTPSVVSVLSTEQIARTGEGDIAGALKRVTGLSLVGGKYVYVRGLGERYSSALLNGLPLPSPEPLKRVVPLDIFPTSAIASSLVQKSYSANFPGEFGGGVINLTTRSIPTERFVEISASVGGNTRTTGQLGYTYQGSGLDVLGWDNGTRDLPSRIASANRSGNRLIVGENFDLAFVQDATASLVNAPTNLIQRNPNIPADFDVGMAAGNSWDVGENLFGIVVAGGWEQTWRTKGGFQQSAGGVSIGPGGEEFLSTDQNFRFLSTEMNVQVTGLLGLAYEFGEHKIRQTNLFVRDSLKEARIQAGTDAVNIDDVTPINRGFTNWFERQLWTSQLVGEFEFGDFSVAARGTYAQSKRDSPYERVNSYRFSPELNDFFNDLRTNGTFSRISFSELDDIVYSGSIDGGYNLPTERPIRASAGFTYYNNDRTSERRDYTYRTADGSALPIEVAQQRPDFLLSDFNVYLYDVVLEETSGSEGAALYDAGLETFAGYVNFDAEVADGVKVTGGVRYEDGSQFVQTIPIFSTDVGGTRTEIDESYWLPGGIVTWNFAADMQVRFSGSKTIARPQFRELAPQQYQDIDTDRTAFGNQFLIDSQLVNFEGRYEWFFEDEARITVGGFYKRINNPIEPVSFESGGTFLITFANAPQARLYGGEMEFVKYFPLDMIGWEPLTERRLLVNLNYTYTNSSLQVDEGDTTINTAGDVIPASGFFRDGAPLVGQSDHLVNLELGISSREGLSEQTLLLGYASERTSQRGPTGTPDYRERPGFQLDFVARQEVSFRGRPVELSFEARNLTGTDYREFQELNDSIIFINQYEIGRSFQAGVKFKF